MVLRLQVVATDTLVGPCMWTMISLALALFVAFGSVSFFLYPNDTTTPIVVDLTSHAELATEVANFLQVDVTAFGNV